MALETLVKAIDLILWANRLEARNRLPLLLRRLIHATTDGVQRIGFPAEEGIQTPGYDGFLVVEKGNAFVPEGCSVWEMGTNSDIKGKADDDFEKRRKDHLDVDPSITTFVFVTPRRWGNKADWIKERKNEGFWHDVRVYDADDLEHWLELTPSVHIWASIMLGKHPKTAEDIATFWENWSSATKPALSPQVLVTGRENIISRIDEWLVADASVLVTKADTQEESIAFFAASLYQKPVEERIQWLSHVLLVNDLETLNQLCVAQTKLILIPTFSPGNSVGRAIQNGHSVFVPLGRDDSSSQSTLELSRQHVGQIKEALLNLGFKEERAVGLATVARRSLMAFRRKLAINPELHEPIWSRPEHAREIISALLLGQWNETKEGDRTAVAKLANRAYEDFMAGLERWANESDPPIRHIGSVWFLTSKEDSWNLLSRYINMDDARKLESLALEVLSEVNPGLDLPINERWIAALHGRVLSYSEHLREGIADTLAIMGAQSAVTSWAHSQSLQDYVNNIVHKLLEQANKDWRIWSSLSPALRLLAEASPDSFLDAVSSGVSGSSPILINIFEEPENTMFYGATYPGLLSALELLAWSPTYLSRAAAVLAALARIDPGGKLGNRPANSLKEIFLIWYPQTTASLEQRLRVVDMLRKREAIITWKLMVDILPEPHAISSPNSTPRWRDWVPDTHPSITWREIGEATHEVVTRLVEDVGVDGRRWKMLIEHLSSLPKEEVDTVIGLLEKLDKDSLNPEDRAIIWQALRTLVARHKRFPDAQWAMPIDVINRLNQVYEHFTPDDLLQKCVWLFGNHTELIGDYGGDWRSHEQAVSIARANAIKEIYEKGGVSMLIDLAEKVEQPYFLGLTIGQAAVSNQDEDELLNHLGSQHNYHRGLLNGFVIMRQKTIGWDWVKGKTDNSLRINYSKEQQSEFFTYLPATKQIWQILETFGTEVQEQYWSVVRPRPFEVDDFNEAIQKLLDHKRPHVALDIITMHIEKISVEISVKLVISCLEMAVVTKPEYDSEWRVFDYIDELFDAIEKAGEIDESKLASLEFSLLPILSRHGGRGPRVLNKELARNPNLFIEALCLAYRAEGEERRDLSDNEKDKARLAYELLFGWKSIPGRNDDGTVNPTELHAWVEKVRELSMQNKRLAIADLLIGKVLSYSPRDSDGTWPSKSIRDLLENVNSDKLNRGFITQVYNNRGVTSRSPLDGGAQERGLAEQYKQYADTVRDSWPVTASVLDKIAKGYVSDARREDLGAELEEDLW